MLEVAKLPVLFGNRTEPVGEFFDVTSRVTVSSPVDLQFAGDTRNVKGIGSCVSSGIVYVENDAGMHAGARMKGGKLIIDSGAGEWLGAEMIGGTIEVRLSAGNCVGAAYRGSRRGMSGGQICIFGEAGDELGLLMRRGQISVGGAIGEFCGASMIAGTIIARKGVGLRCGAGMKRGTIITFGPEPVLPPGFRFACEYQPAYFEVMRKQMAGLFSEAINTVRLYRGDLTTGGRGEIWHVPTRD